MITVTHLSVARPSRMRQLMGAAVALVLAWCVTIGLTAWVVMQTACQGST